jgi:glyoxylase-like metal-dependent hydrolase (beta-lactamase superfamily II)
MGADRQDLARFVEPPPPATPTTDTSTTTTSPAITVTPLLMAIKKQPKCGLAGEATCFRHMELVHVAYLVRHPRGTFLVDAGLSRHARDDLARFGWFTRIAFGFDLRASLADALAAAGRPRVDFVVLTHVHWDHTCGLTELPGVRVLTNADDRAYVQSFHGEEPTVVPSHFHAAQLDTFAWDGPPYENFPSSHDLFGDQSVVLVPLPGHTPGATGVFVNGVRGRRLFFVGDAVWSRDGIRIPSHRPKPLARRVDADRAAVSDTIWRLRHLQERHPEIVIVPAHDGDAYRDVLALDHQP